MTPARDLYAKTGLLGIALVLSGVATYVVAILLSDVSQIVFEVFIVVPSLIIGAALWFWRRWGLLVGVLGGLLGLLLLSEDVDPDLLPIDSFFDFMPLLLAMIGVVIVLVASLVGTISYFQGAVGTDTTRVMTIFKGLVVVLVVVGVISAVFTAFGTDSVSTAEAEGAIVITADGVEWDVSTLEVAAGQVIRVLVKNKDPFVHTFTVTDLDIDEVLGPWSEKVIEVESLDSRIYGFICRVPGHEEDMTGAIDAR